MWARAPQWGYDTVKVNVYGSRIGTPPAPVLLTAATVTE
jgi:hypothetical protein